MIQLNPLSLMMVLSFSSTLFAATIVERPVITSTAFGGGGSVVQYGSKGDAATSGIVIGQAYAEAPALATSGSGTSLVTLNVQNGFWISLDALSSPTSVRPPLLPLSAFSIQAKFFRNSIALDIQLSRTSLVTVQLLDLQGRQVMAPWSGNMNSGTHNLEIPALTLGSQPMLLRVQTNAGEKTFPFTPNLFQ